MKDIQFFLKNQSSDKKLYQLCLSVFFFLGVKIPTNKKRDRERKNTNKNNL